MVLPLFQIVKYFGFFKYIVFIIYIDILYISKCILKTIYVVEKPKCLIIYNGESIGVCILLLDNYLARFKVNYFFL